MAGLNQTSTLAPAPVAVAEAEVDRAAAVQQARRSSGRSGVEVTFREGGVTRTRSMAGFGRAWTREHVLVQVVMQMTYYPGAREFWTEARLVRRRVIEPAWQGRAG